MIKHDLYLFKQDSIEFTQKTESEEFHGCGLEMIDWFHPATVKYFLSWGGEIKYLHNMKV